MQDSGFHFLGALLILVSGSLMLYSAVRLRWDTEYLCSGGIDRGIPCLYDVYDNFNGYNGINGGDLLPPQALPIPGTFPSPDYGPSGYQRLSNGLLDMDGRSFFGGGGGNWLAWLKSSKAHLFEKCYEILPRILHCNRYFELKIAAGVSYSLRAFFNLNPLDKIFFYSVNGFVLQVVALINGVIYAIAGILILSSN